MINPPSEEWLRLVETASRRLAEPPAQVRFDLGVPEIFRSLTASLQNDREAWVKLQGDWYEKQWQLWMRFAANSGARPQSCNDRRFHAQEWNDIAYFDFVRQRYLLNSEWLAEVVEHAGVDEERKKKLKFFTRQFTDALSPANFFALNPEAIKLAVESQGDSTLQGLKHALEDFEKGRVSMTDETTFKWVAISPSLPAPSCTATISSSSSSTHLSRDRCSSGRCSSCRRASTSTTFSIYSRRIRLFAIAQSRA
jgi:polyhydroxyalkanoate synthase subunit PhaC